MHNTAFVQYPACDHVLGVQVDDIIAEEKSTAALMRKDRLGSCAEIPVSVGTSGHVRIAAVGVRSQVC
jgi:hypothetical protein